MIEIDHVSFQYSGAEKENLQDFTLQISKGECVVLTGESGCGKTCVTRLINTLIPHFYEGELKGKISIDGVDTTTIQPHDLSDKIGSVFQNPRSQFFSLDTDSEIVFGMENKGIPYQTIRQQSCLYQRKLPKEMMFLLLKLTNYPLDMPMEFREIYPAGMAGYESGNILSLLLGESAWISLQ